MLLPCSLPVSGKSGMADELSFKNGTEHVSPMSAHGVSLLT